MGMKRARDNTDEDHLDYGEPYEGAACAPPKKVQRVEASSAYGNCYANSSEEIADIKGPPKHKPITLWGEACDDSCSLSPCPINEVLGRRPIATYNGSDLAKLVALVDRDHLDLYKSKWPSFQRAMIGSYILQKYGKTKSTHASRPRATNKVKYHRTGAHKTTGRITIPTRIARDGKSVVLDDSDFELAVTQSSSKVKEPKLQAPPKASLAQKVPTVSNDLTKSTKLSRGTQGATKGLARKVSRTGRSRDSKAMKLGAQSSSEANLHRKLEPNSHMVSKKQHISSLGRALGGKLTSGTRPSKGTENLRPLKGNSPKDTNTPQVSGRRATKINSGIGSSNSRQRSSSEGDTFAPKRSLKLVSAMGKALEKSLDKGLDLKEVLINIERAEAAANVSERGEGPLSYDFAEASLGKAMRSSRLRTYMRRSLQKCLDKRNNTLTVLENIRQCEEPATYTLFDAPD